MSSRFDLRYLALSIGLAVLLGGVAYPSLAPQSPKQPTVDFNRDVRPLLAQHCWPCHGQDKDALKKTGNVSLDSFDGAIADHHGIHAIVPGKPEKSELIARASAADPEMRMPPKDSGIRPLSDSEIATIRTWIQEGAEFRAHWAFLPPKMPPLPAVKNANWPKNEVDRFILSRLEQQGLKPEPEADRRTLIRRATFTLTGLPPTPQEVDAFLQDKRPDAYGRLVDRLLASPRYGENQARYWLDAVRYADTHGLHIDNERAIYPYRDWVVRAYNEDLPFDKFALWQLAGDLLPSPTLEQKIATGYVRLNPTTNEGGAIEAEFLSKNTFDRVDTTATVFLGVTLQCAKCHDHKYDPFTQRDYYSMYAFFDSTTDTPLDGNLRVPEPVIKAPTPEQAKRIAILALQMKAIVAKIDFAQAKNWALETGAKLPTASNWEVSGPYPTKSFDAGFDTNYGPEPIQQPTTNNQLPWRPVKFELEKPVFSLVGKDNSVAYLRGTLKVEAAAKMEIRLGSDDAIKVWLNGVLVHKNKIQRSLKANDDKVDVNLNAGENQLLLKIVNAGGEDGAFVGLGGAEAKKILLAHELAKSNALDTEQSNEIVQTYLESGPATELARDYRKLQVAYKVQDSLIPMTLVAKEMPKPRPTFILKRGQYDQPGDPVTRAIPKVFGTFPDVAAERALRSPDVESSKLRIPTHELEVRVRMLPPPSRLDLAEWIVDPKNPLTARVMVNKIWQQHFGAGLVKSSEDFGSRGDWPTNPALMDYLACRFVKDGWSIKKLTRLILTSATYRQSAACPAAKRQKDPDNTWLSRGPRFRLDAEVIRDTALYVSGLLFEKPGGHADKPYQPPGLWEIIAYPISDTAKYMQDHGQALYRRSMYMFWKRTSPPPTMMLFDAPMRESCVVRRSRTNTPTQALATLNETGFFEDARAMAQRVIKSKPDDASRIHYAFRLATGRPPTAQEVDVVKNFLHAELDRYRAHPAEAEKSLAIGESKRDKTIPTTVHAAWTLVCNMILNLDETLTQH